MQCWRISKRWRFAKGKSAFAGLVVKPVTYQMDIIHIKPLNEMTLVELLSAYGRTVRAQANCQVSFGTEYAEHTQAIQAITEEAQRRDDRARFGAMFAPKPVNREPDGDILFA